MTICADGGVYVWDFAGMTVTALPLDGRVSPDGSIWLSVSESGATLRETLTSKVIGQINASDEHFSRVEFSRDHRFVAFLSSHQTDSMGKKLVVEVQDITGKNAKQIFAVAYDNPNIVLNDDGSRLATFAGTNMDVWEVRSGNKLASLSQATDVVQVLFDKTGNRLVVGTGKFFRIFDLATREEVCAPLMHAHPVVHAEYSRDESLLVTCCSARDVSPSYAQVWDARNGKEVGYRLDHSDGIIDVTLSPDGSKVATAGEDFNAIVWDYLNGKPTIPLLRHNHQIHKIRFTPNGKWIVTASSDKSTRIWDCRTGNPLTPPLKHLAPLEDAEFLDGGPHIVTTDMQNQSIVWELPTTDQFMTDAGSLARLLSADALGSAYEVLSRNASAVLWQQLRAKYPSAFNVSEMEIQRWHENRIAELELNQNWAAAAFHRNQLLKANPNDSIPTDRLARVKEQLEREHLKAARAP
jgi:WD40 repeat protein